MKKIAAVITYCLICSFSFAQNSRIWSTYYGGSGTDGGSSECISNAVDRWGNVYLAGSTSSLDHIADGGFQDSLSGGGAIDGFLVKLDGSGNRLWATYYGGINDEYGTSVATDPWGNVYFAGSTLSISGIAFNGFQNTSGGANDCFLVKFDSAGNRIWATYYGGPLGENSPSVAVDNVGNIYLSGFTSSLTGIAYGGFQNTHGGSTWDAFLVKFDSSGSRLWATYYGGSSNDQTLGGSACAIDSYGNVYLCGSTGSSNGIAFNGFQNFFSGPSNDAFLVKFNSAGTRLWATYYGGYGGQDEGTAITTDVFGNIYLGGLTYGSTNLSTVGSHQDYFGGYADAFLVKFDSSGNRLWATYYGGLGRDYILSLASDSTANIYVGGMTESTNNISSNGFENIAPGDFDCFVAKFDSAGNRYCATYFGSPQDEGTLVGASIALDNLNNIYLASATESMTGIAYGGFQNVYGGGITDVFLAKFTSCVAPLTISTLSTGVFCAGQCIGTASVSGSNGYPPYTYLWSNSQTTSGINNLCAGVYTVTVTDTFNISVTSSVTITEPPQLTDTISSAPTDISCIGIATIVVNGGTPPLSYLWSNSGITSTINNLCSGWYYVTVTDANDCQITDSVYVSLDVGISDLRVLQNINFFPNPTVKELRIESAELKIKEIEIYSSLGEKVFSQTQTTNHRQQTIDISQLPSGIYFITVTDQAENKVTKKVIKM